MNFYERLKSLAKEKNKSFNQIEADLNYSKNTLYSYKRKTPNASRVKEISNYFNVSTDYLLGYDDTKNKNNFSEQENDLVAAFRMESKDMTEEEQAEFNEALKDMMKLAKKLLNDSSNWKNK